MTRDTKKLFAIFALAACLGPVWQKAGAQTLDIYELKDSGGERHSSLTRPLSFAEQEYLSEDIIGREERLRKVRAKFARILKTADDVTGTKQQLIERLIRPFPKTYQPPTLMIEQVRGGLNYFPRSILAMMVKKNYKVYLADKVSNLRAGLSKKHPGSYPEGETYDNVPAFANWRGKYIAIGHRYRSDGKFIPDFSIDESVRHEVGHVLDYSFGSPTYDDDFYYACRSDIAAMDPLERKYLSQYLYRRGRHEVFADLVEAYYRFPKAEPWDGITLTLSRSYSVMCDILPAPEDASRAIVEKKKAYSKAYWSKDYAQAATLAQEMVDLKRRLDPCGSGAAEFYGYLVSSQRAGGDLKSAQISCLKEIACYPPIDGCENPEIAHSLLLLAGLKGYIGDYKESEKLCARAEAALKTEMQWHRGEQVELLLEKSSDAQLREDYSAAMAYATEALSKAEEFLGLKSDEIIKAQERVGDVAICQNQLDRADVTLKVALKRAEAAKNIGMQCWLEVSLANSQRLRGNFEDAKHFLAAANQNFEATFPAEHPYRTTLFISSARLNLAQKHYAEAEADIKEGVKLSEKLDFGYDLNLIELWKIYAELLKNTGRTIEADEMQAKAVAMQNAYDEK